MNATATQLAHDDDQDIVELTSDEIVARIRRALAKRQLNMSVREFVERFRRDKLDDPGRVADLVILLNLLSDTE